MARLPRRPGATTAEALALSSCIFPTRPSGNGFRSAWSRSTPEPDRRQILERLIQADLFEQVIQSRYLGTKRFSLEGVTVLIPFLDEILNHAADHGARRPWWG